MATIDKICKEEANAYILFDPHVIKGLYQQGLIRCPVYPDDLFKVSRLEGFVSNREQSYEDPIEELLYAVFVVSSENATVAELAATLQADLLQLQSAASFACRLGWAIKVIDLASVLQERSIAGHPRSVRSDEDAFSAGEGSESILTDGYAAQQGDVSGTDNNKPTSEHVCVSFIVDANITSYLMMGSVSPGLRVGKLGHGSIADLCKDLSSLGGMKLEGELQEFANHASSLRCGLECLQSGGVITDASTERVCNKFENLVSSEDTAILVADISLPDKLGNDSPNKNGLEGDDSLTSEAPGEDSILEEPSAASTGDEPSATSNSSEVSSNCLNGATSFNLNVQNDDRVVPVEGVDMGKGAFRRKKKYQVDVLRCESLASLAPATLAHLFLPDYDLVIVMALLPLSSVRAVHRTDTFWPSIILAHDTLDEVGTVLNSG